jgi:hypothetical protein
VSRLWSRACMSRSARRHTDGFADLCMPTLRVGYLAGCDFPFGYWRLALWDIRGMGIGEYLRPRAMRRSSRRSATALSNRPPAAPGWALLSPTSLGPLGSNPGGGNALARRELRVPVWAFTIPSRGVLPWFRPRPMFLRPIPRPIFPRPIPRPMLSARVAPRPMSPRPLLPWPVSHACFPQPIFRARCSASGVARTLFPSR